MPLSALRISGQKILTEAVCAWCDYVRMLSHLSFKHFQHIYSVKLKCVTLQRTVLVYLPLAHIAQSTSNIAQSTANIAQSTSNIAQSTSNIAQSTSAEVNEGPSTVDSPETPRKASLKRKLSEVQDQLPSTRKKVKTLLQSKRRLMKKNAGLKNIVSDLRKHSLVCDNSLSVLEQSAGGVSDLLKRQIAKKTNNPLPVSYSPELRSFALTLHFYSPHAYRYVRKMFDTCLPHPRTIERWYQSIDGFRARKTIFPAESRNFFKTGHRQLEPLTVVDNKR